MPHLCAKAYALHASSAATTPVAVRVHNTTADAADDRADANTPPSWSPAAPYMSWSPPRAHTHSNMHMGSSSSNQTTPYRKREQQAAQSRATSPDTTAATPLQPRRRGDEDDAGDKLTHIRLGCFADEAVNDTVLCGVLHASNADDAFALRVMDMCSRMTVW